MKRLPAGRLTAVLIITLSLNMTPQSTPAVAPSFYLGFDRNDYPGDANLKLLRQTFSYAGFWLNQPPGEKTNTWAGQRQAVQSAGLGFLVLFNGRLNSQLKTVRNAGRLGKSDAQIAAASARREGFPPGTIIFLDQEEGGRMLPAQKAYIYAWVDGVAAAGFHAGIYCSGIAARKMAARPWSPLKISGKTQRAGASCIGSRMMPARLRRDAPSPGLHPAHLIAASTSRKYGNLRNLRSGEISPPGVPPTTTATEAAIHRGSFPGSTCIWT